MAYVSIRWGKSASHHINYALKDRAPDDAVYAHDCSLETASSDFESVRCEHQKESGNQVLHVMQSFSPNDSKMRDPEEFNALGRSIAARNFPGHQFIVKTHTDTGKIHNHIIINTVNSENGKKIENKRALIFRLQDSSDRICKEYGLSIINRDAKERQARLPYKVQQMVRAGKQSYIFDLSQKADVARSIATGFDEYRDLLAGFGIRTVVENKNVSYFYPGQERGKRGSKLGRAYGKEGLEEKFNSNDKKFSGYPDLKEQFYNQYAQIQKQGMPSIPEGASNFAKLWDGGYVPWRHPHQYTRINRRQSEEQFKSDAALARAFVPANEIKKAREQSIFDYCRCNNIELKTNEKGETVFKGKEFVTVSEFGFINTKNGTRGSLIDIVAAHKNMTLIQAVAHLNGNSRLLLLEQSAGAVPQRYRSFHLPKPEKNSANQIAEKLHGALKKLNSNSSLSSNFHERRVDKLGQQGTVWLFANDTHNFHEHNGITMPVFQHQLALFSFFNFDRKNGVMSLSTQVERSVDLFLIENPGVKKINFTLLSPDEGTKAGSGLFTFLRQKYESQGIGVEMHTNERSMQRAFELDVPNRGLSRRKGGMGIGF